MLFNTVSLAKASDQTTKAITLDKGQIVLNFDSKQLEPLVYKVKLPAECLDTTEVKVKLENNTLQMRHVGSHCPAGATVYLTINPEIAKLKIKLAAGVVTIKGSAMSKTQTMSTIVQSGVIQSTMLDVKSINFHAGKKGVYTTSKTGELTLQVKVQAGVIKTP